MDKKLSENIRVNLKTNQINLNIQKILFENLNFSSEATLVI